MPRKKASGFSLLAPDSLGLVAACFHALSDPTRLRILQALKQSELSVHELVRLFDFTQPNISRHLAILTRAGLVNRSRRGMFSYYRVASPRVFELCDRVCGHVGDMLNRYGGPADSGKAPRRRQRRGR